eukprot:gene12267-12405_t
MLPLSTGATSREVRKRSGHRRTPSDLQDAEDDIGSGGLLSNELEEQDDQGDKFAQPAPGAYSVGAPANKAAGGLPLGDVAVMAARAKIVFNVHIHNQSDEDTAFARDQTRTSKSGRTTYKSAEFQSGLKRVFGVFLPKNVGDLGGVMDPYALLLLLVLCLASVGIGVYRTVEAFTTPGTSLWMACAFTALPLCWAINGAIAPYLFIHYCFSGGKSFKRAASFLRFLQTILSIGSIIFLWIGKPVDIPVGAALQQGVSFLSQQVAIGKSQSDIVTLGSGANSKLLDVTGGFFPSGSDPVKYSVGIAHTTTMLAWGLTEFKQGFDSSGGRATTHQAAEVVAAGADFLAKAIASTDPNNPMFVARVGDPEKYITAGVTPTSVMGMESSQLLPVAGAAGGANNTKYKVWSDPTSELNAALKTGRPAVVITYDTPGVDAVASAAAALAAASIAVQGTPYADRAAEYKNKAAFLYQFAKNQITKAQKAAAISVQTKVKGLTSAFDPAQLSYCAGGRCSYNVEVEQQVLLVEKDSAGEAGTERYE